jgi:hypothetical protein
MSNDGPRETAQQAHAVWDQYVAERKKLVQAGRAAAKARHDFAILDDDERAQLRDAPKTKPVKVPKPFHPPKLKPDLRYLCDQAHMLISSAHTGGPIGAFESESKMVEDCKQFAVVPVDPDRTCPAETHVRCGLEPSVCCPRELPIYNACSQKCYRNTDFVAGPDDGLHCSESRDCAAFNPTSPSP